jgi:hypothetical protein
VSVLELLHERTEWLSVGVLTHPQGGEEIVLRLDGTYAAGLGKEMAEHWRRELLEALEADGFPLEELESWTRWPERVEKKRGS